MATGEMPMDHASDTAAIAPRANAEPLRADDVVAALRARRPAAGAGRAASDQAANAQKLCHATIDMLAAIAADPELGPRVACADTTVDVHLIDAAEPASFAMLLDRTPIEALDGATGEAEITVYLTAADLRAIWAGELRPAIAITDGRLGYEGPVRKLLRVLPIMLCFSDAFAGALGDSAPTAPPRSEEGR
jgi:hypothetical protein